MLRAHLAGETLGDALATLSAQSAANPQLEGDVTAWFRAWVGGGFFSGIELKT